MVDREATPSHYDRPDPDEPWRFVCPECRSPTIDSLKEKYVHGGHHQLTFYCRNCNEKLEYVIDQKSGKRVYQWDPDRGDS